MNRRFALLGLSLVFCAQDLGGWTALADQIVSTPSRQSVLAPCPDGCSPFEGYVVVPRRQAADAPADVVARPDAVFSANRLYLPTDDEKSP